VGFWALNGVPTYDLLGSHSELSDENAARLFEEADAVGLLESSLASDPNGGDGFTLVCDVVEGSHCSIRSMTDSGLAHDLDREFTNELIDGLHGKMIEDSVDNVMAVQCVRAGRLASPLKDFSCKMNRFGDLQASGNWKSLTSEQGSRR